MHGHDRLTDNGQAGDLPEFDAAVAHLARLTDLARGWNTLVERHSATFTAAPRCRRHRSIDSPG